MKVPDIVQMHATSARPGRKAGSPSSRLQTRGRRPNRNPTHNLGCEPFRPAIDRKMHSREDADALVYGRGCKRTMTVFAQNTGWWVGLGLGFVVVAVVVVIVSTILTLAARIADSARAATAALPVVRDQTDALRDVGSINESAISILRSARAARKALTGS